LTPLPRPYSESGKLHYYKGHLADSGAPGADAGPMEEQIKRSGGDWAKYQDEDYVVALYWLTATVLFSKDKSPQVTEESRKEATAEIEKWADKKGYKLNILEGYAEPEDYASDTPEVTIDWEKMGPPQEGGGGTETK
jgi:hypothetical protein